MAANGLNRRQLAFIDAYVGRVDGVQRFNATAAARHAGYKDPEQSAFDNKQNLAITARIEEILNAEAMTPAETLSELRDVATAEWRDFVIVRSNPRTGEIIETRMDLRSKVQALELIGKAHKLFTDKIEHGADESFLSALKAFADGHGAA